MSKGLPRSLARWLPQLHVEGRAEAYLPARETETSAAVPV